MFKRLIGGLFIATGAIVLAASVIGVLVGVERLLSERANRKSEPEGHEPEIEPTVKLAASPQIASSPKERHFSIKRTKSEVGYVYWILQGYGKYKCYVLCDSWEEAVEQAKARLEADAEEIHEFAFAHLA